MRADAVERRRRLIFAGRALFAERGGGVPFDTVAEAAHVGVATLYRNFPTRLDLKIAILTDALIASRCTLHDLRDTVEADAQAAMTGLVRMFVSLKLGGLITTIAYDREPLSQELIESLRSYLAAIAEILDRAKTKGAVREEITLQDFFAGAALLSRSTPSLATDPLMCGSTRPAEVTERVLAIFVAGLKPSP